MNPFPFVLLSLARFSFWYMNDFIIHKQEVNADPNSGIKTNVSSLAQTYTHMLANNWDIAYISLLCVCASVSAFPISISSSLFSVWQSFNALFPQLFYRTLSLSLSHSCHCHSKQHWSEQKHEIAIANHGRSEEKCNLRLKMVQMIGWNIYLKNVEIGW